MCRFRSYFSKNNTIVKNSSLNSSQNPVTELVYGGKENEKALTRFIFDIDLQPLIDKINKGYINKDNIVKHVLHLTNTIRYRPENLGRTTYNRNVDRATSFGLDLFSFDEDWHEGTGYDLVYTNEFQVQPNETPSNWFYKKTDQEWNTEGVYESGTTLTVGSQNFDKGNENIEIDITDYINDRINGVSDSKGLGLKFINDLEEKITDRLQSVGFHTKYTHTFFQPFVETIMDDRIVDDRYDFYFDRENTLCFYAGGLNEDDTVEIDSVEIYDHLNKEYRVFDTSEVHHIAHKIYCVKLTIGGEEYPDAVIFNDVWNVRINGVSRVHKDRFYVVPSSEEFGKHTDLNFGNYHFYFTGIVQNEKIKKGEIRKIYLTIKELYAQTGSISPSNIEYRIMANVDNMNEIEIVPFTPMNRIRASYEFFLDTSWLIPNDYFIEVRIRENQLAETKETLSFTVT